MEKPLGGPYDLLVFGQRVRLEYAMNGPGPFWCVRKHTVDIPDDHEHPDSVHTFFISRPPFPSGIG